MLFPACLPGEHPLDTATKQQNDNDIMEDSLSCPTCGRTYPVENGVAYILPNDLTTVTYGELLESGERLEDALTRIEGQEGERCLHLMELSLNVEYPTYDLHRATAERFEEEETREAFLSLAQAEKGHMRTITKAIRMCVE